MTIPQPGTDVSPIRKVSTTTHPQNYQGPTRKGREERGKKLTSVSLLANHVINRTLTRHAHGLLLNSAAPVVEALGLVHGALQRVALPPEHVVGVGAVSGPFEAPDERVRRAGGPHGVELAGVPDRLEGHLGDAHGVRGRAGGRVGEAF